MVRAGGFGWRNLARMRSFDLDATVPPLRDNGSIRDLNHERSPTEPSARAVPHVEAPSQRRQPSVKRPQLDPRRHQRGCQQQQVDQADA